MKKKEFLKEVATEATRLGKEERYKHNVSVTQPLAESVLEATGNVMNDYLAKADEPVLTVPHIGTFKTRTKLGQANKQIRNPRTGETYFKDTEDKHRIVFKQSGPDAKVFDELRKAALNNKK